VKATPNIVLIGTLDTKSDEIGFVRDLLHSYGATTTVIDSGVLGTPTLEADIPRAQVAEAAGHTLEYVQNTGSRGDAIVLMQQGLRVLSRRLFDAGSVDGVLCLGGAEGGLMGAAAMQVLPVGVPKVIVSPSASGRREFGPFMGSSDILVMHSIIDILGLNSVARSVFANAAAAVFGMATMAGEPPSSDRPSIGMTMLGQTTPGAMVIAKRLEAAGFEPVIFHANGVGGPAMDAMARDGLLVGVLDFTLSEPANSLFDGVTAAVRAGIPLLVVPGAGDFFNQGAMSTVPEKYRSRQLYHHNPVATLVRLGVDDMRDLARIIVQRLEGASAPTEVMVPTGGLSLIGVPGGPIAFEEADLALVEALREFLPDTIPLTVVDDHINSPAFADAVADRFLAMVAVAGFTGAANR
jgi:uncharacterized protein (UPF0261 family)